MKSVLSLATILYVFALAPAYAGQGDARILSDEYQLCMDAVPGADLSSRSVVDVELIDVIMQGRKASIAIDPLGIGAYNRLVSELGIKGRRYRSDGVIIYAKTYDRNKVLVIGRKERMEGGGDVWVYVSSEQSSGAESTVIDQVVNALHVCHPS